MQLIVNGQEQSVDDASTLLNLLIEMNFNAEQKGYCRGCKCRGDSAGDVGRYAVVQWRPGGYYSRGSGGVGKCEG